MTVSACVQRFRQVRDPALVDPHVLSDDRVRVLWVLAAAKDDPELGYMSPAQVAEILCDGEGISISRQRVAGILQREGGTIAKRRRQGRLQYRIMREGLQEIPSSEFGVMFIDPDRALTEIRKFEDILLSLRGNVKVCDPYFENKSLDFLLECKNAKSISILTVNIIKESALRRDFSAFRNQFKLGCEIRIAQDNKLHDRYIIHDGGMFIIGTSLNGFAKKQSFIVSVGSDVRAIVDTAFQKNWNSAPKFQ